MLVCAVVDLVGRFLSNPDEWYSKGGKNTNGNILEVRAYGEMTIDRMYKIGDYVMVTRVWYSRNQNVGVPSL